ncbi:hypothetical protein GCM10025869_18980 [Homoserinibacter gongjuensis]|uniref:Uncharacterized protein n=1 Tax=Homoserinibacter gongjuensis TaxID=1162968 RepID=A0ABQ6JW85_9MICO|nr:hypothetical protein GCM10025869_18980 [Homoserinibacter gongjuensis]
MATWAVEWTFDLKGEGFGETFTRKVKVEERRAKRDASRNPRRYDKAGGSHKESPAFALPG